ncbi:MAG: hypothetical protein EBX30_13075 [Betaproteobacteria bacterium]|nr:hypothetical protein [Betaproteobacteria bacterium]NCY08111.1 hypothetical protein [Betaproteobacteria bacterium]
MTQSGLRSTQIHYQIADIKIWPAWRVLCEPSPYLPDAGRTAWQLRLKQVAEPLVGVFGISCGVI